MKIIPDEMINKILDENEQLEKEIEDLKKRINKVKSHKKTLIATMSDDYVSKSLPKYNSQAMKKIGLMNTPRGIIITISLPKYSKNNIDRLFLTEYNILKLNSGYKAMRIFKRNKMNKHNHPFEIYTTTVFPEENIERIEIVDSENHVFTTFSSFKEQFDDFPFNLYSWLNPF